MLFLLVLSLQSKLLIAAWNAHDFMVGLEKNIFQELGMVLDECVAIIKDKIPLLGQALLSLLTHGYIFSKLFDVELYFW